MMATAYVIGIFRIIGRANRIESYAYPESGQGCVFAPAAAVATAKQLHRRGQRSLREIADELARLGHVNRRGNVYSASAIASMLGGAK
jgi:hypothetical protein